MSKLSLVIPAYNEEKRIKKTLLDYESYFKNRHRKYEIIVVCDGCKDKTPQIVRRFCKKNRNIKILEFDKRLGKGGGIYEGFKVSSGEILGFVDADGSVIPPEFDKLIKKIENSTDCAIGSRKIKGAKIISYPIRRMFFSEIFNLFIRLLFGLPFTDTQCGGKVFKKSVIENVLKHLKLKGFEFDVELLWKIKKMGFRAEEVPIVWKHHRESKFNLKNGLEMVGNLVKIRVQELLRNIID